MVVVLALALGFQGGYDGFETKLAEIIAGTKTPGIAAAVISESGPPLVWVAGVRKQGENNPVTPGDLWHLGSCTKAMTGSIMSMLASEGSFSLGQTVQTTFPTLSFHNGFNGVTLRHLLAMRGGLPTNTPWWNYDAMGTSLRNQRVQAATDSFGVAPSQSAGTYTYSNASFVFAGLAAEQALNQDFEDILQNRLFAPLGITTAGYGPTGANQPWPHNDSGPVPPTSALDNPPVMTAAGRAHMTIQDWGRYIQTVIRALNSRSSILPASYNTEMRNPALGGTYTMGWNSGTRSWSNGTVFFHAGSNTLNYCVAWVAPGRRKAFIVTSNYGGSQAAGICDQVIIEMITRTAPALHSVQLSSNSVVGGNSVTGTVSMDLNSTTSGGSIVNLSDDGPDLSTPSTVLIPQGTKTASFEVQTTTVTTTQNRTITATLAGVTETASLTILPVLGLSAVTVSPTSIIGGNTATGTATLNRANSSSITVDLSDNSELASTPASVLVPANSDSGTFSISTSVVQTTTNVTITATYNSVNKTAILKLTPNGLFVSGFEITPGTMAGGGIATGTITLSQAAPTGGAAVTMIESAAEITVPATVTVPAGSTTAPVNITTVPVKNTVARTVSARLNNVTETATITLTPIHITNCLITPANVVGGNPASETVTLSAPAPPGYVLTVRDNDARTGVPATVTVPEGSTSVTFPITSQGTSVQFTSEIRVSKGSQMFRRFLVVYAPALSTFNLTPASLKGGQTAVGTITLNGKAFAAGIYVSVSSDGPEAIVPSTVGFPQNVSQKTFNIQTTTVNARVIRTITVTYLGVTRTKTITINK